MRTYVGHPLVLLATMKYITVKLTEDQRRFVMKVLSENLENKVLIEQKITKQELAYSKRVLNKLYKAS